MHAIPAYRTFTLNCAGMPTCLGGYHRPANVGHWQIMLQKSQNAVRLNFRQRTKQAAIVDLCRFKRATEVVSEFVTE
jgi:hypothetical protein